MSGPLVHAAIVTPIAFPDPPLLNVAVVHQPWALRSIIEVRVGGEHVGLGESYGDEPHLALLHRAAAALVGLDPFDLAGLHRRGGRGHRGHRRCGPARADRRLEPGQDPGQSDLAVRGGLP